MISWLEAQEIIKNNIKTMPIITKATHEVLGDILAQDIIATADLPPFNNSAMDGYALRAEWVKDASADHPIALNVKGQILAGHNDGYTENTAIAIMTGAKVPDYFDAVIPVEMVTPQGEQIIIQTTRKVGENIRPQGSDLCKGDILITKGTKINAYHISLMGAQGLSNVQVYQKPRIAVIITGDEVGKENNDSNQIADANGPFLQAAIHQNGGNLVGLYHLSDNEQKFHQLIATLKGNVDCIISTGAVSAGVKDFIPNEILAEGGKIHFHKIYQRPGKPLLFAALSDGTYWFGLPGNPVAVQASFIFSVTTWLNAACQTSPLKTDKAILTGEYHKKADFQMFLRGNCYTNDKGETHVDLAAGQASYQLKNWGKVNCWVIATAGKEEFKTGDIVEILRI
ncbi:MAG: molybdopterin molybdotransferase MoeA [Alphaproteobacteria bacterium]